MTPVFTVTRKVPPELLDIPNLDCENSSIVPQMCVEEDKHICPIKSNQSILCEKLNNIYKELNTVSQGLTADKQLCSNLASVDPQVMEYWNKLENSLLMTTQIANDISANSQGIGSIYFKQAIPN